MRVDDVAGPQYMRCPSYKGNKVEAGAMLTLDGYKNETTNTTQLAGSVLVKVAGVDVSFQFDTRHGGSFSLAASKTWVFDWGVMVLYGQFSSGDCNDTMPAPGITLKTAVAGKLTLTEFKAGRTPYL